VRLAAILVLGGLALGPPSVDMYLPALPAIARELGAPYAAVQQSVSTFVLVLAAGRLLMPTTLRPNSRP
jgi:MFS transporter, DHA1 family, multidrug resistance protein